ncbi:Lipoate-protein ligase A subunit 2 [uncultured archaeon]|nr:Lipoate-protein ligase A subunit 2 [uncultured archaeon]
MIACAKQKVREGKLVKVEIEYDESIKKLKITGDFFMYPEDALERIEKTIVGLKKDAGMETIASKIRSIVEIEDVQMIGISAESLARVIREALG